MTKSQNTKNEQQKDLCIISEQLTEQMHKGELPEGWYYVIKTGDVEMLEYSCNCFLAGDVPLIDNEVTEVLAPVPSYEKLQNMNKAVNECMAANIKLVEQNTQFKELLKECELWFTGIVENINDKNVGEHNRNLPIGNFEYIFKEFSRKTDEAIKKTLDNANKR